MTFDLPNGDKIEVYLEEDGPLGTPGMRVSIRALRGVLIVAPAANNSVQVTTERALIDERRNVATTIAERKPRAPR